MRRERRNDSVEWNRRRERNYERERALQALRSAMFFLLVSFVILSITFGIAWNQ
jgi:ABC-type lipoprotein release transport system permease subunit